MDRHGSDREVFQPYSPTKQFSKRKEQITPWSFYQQNAQIKHLIDPSVAQEENKPNAEDKPDSRKRKSHKSNSAAKQAQSKQKRTPTKTSEPNPELDKREQNQKAYEQMRITSKQISELLRQRIILRAVMKYMEITDSTTKRKEQHKQPSPKKGIVEINITPSMEHEQSKQLHRKSEEKAFNDIQMQIHSMPAELKLRNSKRPSLRIVSKREDTSSYAEYNFKHSIEVSGEKKQFTLKES